MSVFAQMFDKEPDLLIGTAIELAGSNTMRKIIIPDITDIAVLLNNMLARVPWGKFYKRSLIGLLRFSAMSIGEDTEFNLKYFRKVKTIRSTRVVSVSHSYIYRGVSVAEFLTKYKITAVKSTEYLLNIIRAYNSLGVRNYEFEQNMIDLFYRLASDDMPALINKWYGNKEIRRFSLSMSRHYGFESYIRTYVKFMPGIYKLRSLLN